MVVHMSSLLDIFLLPNFYMFLSMVSIPILLAVNGRKKLSGNRGYIILLLGTGLLSLGSFIEIFDELPIGDFLDYYTFAGLAADKSRMLVLFVPSIFLVGLGLSYWLPDIKRLSNEIDRRTNAEQEMLNLLREMEVLTRKEEEANQAKGEFLATMSHELRTPLNAVIGFAEVLNMPDFKRTEQQKEEYLSIIVDSGKHLLSLINDILDLSKLDQGKLNLSYSTFNISDEILSIIETLKLSAKEKNIELQQNLMDLEISSDQRLFKQIILNILSNAIKFSPEKSFVNISAEPANDGVCITVKDNGIGMTDEEILKVMEPFVQIENTYTRTIEGSGLGLSLVSRFLKLLGGEMKISSVKGRGTTVRLFFPNFN